MVEKISVEIGLDGGQEVERQLENIGKAGEQALGNIQNAADGLDLTSVADQFQSVQKTVQSAAAFEQVVQGVKKVEGAFDSLGNAVAKVASRMTRSLGVIGVAARALGPLGIALGVVGGAFIKFGDDSADALNKLTVAAAKLGQTPQQLDRVQKALTSLGVAPDAVISGLQKLQEAAAQDFFPTDPITKFQQVIAELERMPDSVARTQTAIAQLGDAFGGAVIAGLQTGTLSAQTFAAALGQVTPATQAQIIAANQYQEALNKLNAAWTELKATFTPIVTPIFGFITQEIKAFTADIKALMIDVEALWNLLKSLGGVFTAKGPEQLKDALSGVRDAYNKLGTGAQQVEEQVKQTGTAGLQAGNQIAQGAKTAADAEETLAQKHERIRATQSAANAQMRAQEEAEAQAAAQRAAQRSAAHQADSQAMAALDRQNAEDSARNAAAAAAAIAQAYQKAGQAGAAAGLQIAQAMNAGAQATGNYLIVLRGVIVQLNGVTEAAARAAQFIGNLPRPREVGGGRPAPIGAGRPDPLGFAGGGLLGGRGTGISDSNLAWVSRGEHIMPARAVAQPGVLSFLEALRRTGGNLRGVLNGMSRFALGGLVPHAPAFAAGGSVGSMSHVTIQFPGVPPVSGLRASVAVIDQLQKTAALAQVRSGGRKPSRYS